MSRSTYSSFAGLTDPGTSRSHNEDSFAAKPPLFAVADGLGGHKAGEIASTVAIEHLLEAAPEAPHADALRRAVEGANAAVIDAAADGRGRPGMGTTLTAAVVVGSRVVIAHVGDSRAYLLSGGELERVTRDHSLVADLVRKGEISEEEARIHPQRAVITRALGSRAEVAADTYEFDAMPGDRLLLCSDGLHGMLLDDEIERILAEAQDAAAAVRELVRAANDAGGLDNITAVVTEIGPARQVAPAVSRKSRSWLSAVAWVLAAVALATAAWFGLLSYARAQAYVIAEDGRIAVYRGLSGSFAGLTMSWLEQRTEVEVDKLPVVLVERLEDGVATDGLDAAFELVAEYRALASDDSTPAAAP